MTQVLTITLNPAIDQTIPLNELKPGAVHRAAGYTSTAGGKGIGMSIIMADLGLPTIATGWIGRDNDSLFTEVFSQHRIKDAMIRLPGCTRTNIKLIDINRGEATDINLPGLRLSASERTQAERELAGQVEQLSRPGDWCELAGSLPPGCDVRTWFGLARLLAAKNVHLVIDVAGAPLGELLQGWANQVSPTVGPVLIKPNKSELEELVGHPLDSEAELIAAAEHLRTGGVQRVVVSLGSEGALIIGPEGRWRANPPKVRVATPVGAGDTLVAGTTAALIQGKPFPDAAVWGMACAAARIQQIAARLPPVEMIEALAAQISVTPR